jgi:predicted transcriptional regulator
MNRKLYEIAADIIEAQASIGQMTPDNLAQSLESVFITLQRMKMAEDGGVLIDQVKSSEETVAQQEVSQEQEIDPKKSIQNDKIVCLECGTEMRQLTAKHLGAHGLTQKEYRKKYGFSMRTPLSAKSLSKARSKAAKKRGLPEKLQQFQARKRQEKMEAAMIETADPSSTHLDEAKATAPAKRGRKKKTEK